MKNTAQLLHSGTLTAIDSDGERSISLDEQDQKNLALIEKIYSDLWNRTRDVPWTERKTANSPFAPNIRRWQNEIETSLKVFVPVYREQFKEALNFLIKNQIVRVQLTNESFLGNEMTFLTINAELMPIIKEFGSSEK